MYIRKYSRAEASRRYEHFIGDMKRGLVTLAVMLFVVCSMLGATRSFEDTQDVLPEVSEIPVPVLEEEISDEVPYIHIPESETPLMDTPDTDDIDTQDAITVDDMMEETPEPVVEETLVVEDEPVAEPIPCSEKERDMMLYTVELETHGASFEHKQIVACVIINRMYSDAFSSQTTIEEVLTAKNQFSGISNYYKKFYDPDQDTIDAVDSVLSGEVDLDEVSMGATFFYNPTRVGKRLSSFENRIFLFELEGHRFFK